MWHRGKKRKCDFFFLPKTHKEDKLGYSRMIIWVQQTQRVEVFRVEYLAIRFCGDVFNPRDIIVFFQFIVNLGFGYNLSVIISILL